MARRDHLSLVCIAVMMLVALPGSLVFADMGSEAGLEQEIRNDIGQVNYVEPLIVAKKLKVPQYYVFTEIRSKDLCGEASLRYLATEGTAVSREALRDSVISNAVGLGYVPSSSDMQRIASILNREKEADSQLKDLEQVLQDNDCVMKSGSGSALKDGSGKLKLRIQQITEEAGQGNYFGKTQMLFPEYGQKNHAEIEKNPFLVY